MAMYTDFPLMFEVDAIMLSKLGNAAQDVLEEEAHDPRDDGKLALARIRQKLLEELVKDTGTSHRRPEAAEYATAGDLPNMWRILEQNKHMPSPTQGAVRTSTSVN